jgi:hypothetical protein
VKNSAIVGLKMQTVMLFCGSRHLLVSSVTVNTTLLVATSRAS